MCPTHGGSAPQVKAAGLRRVEERRIGRLVAAQPLRPVGSGLEGLLELTAEVVRWKDFLAARLDDLEEMRFRDDKGGEQLRSEVALFERALDRCGRFLLDVAKLNIEERLARVEERQAAFLIEVIRRALVAAGVPAGSEAATKAVGGALRELAAGGG